MEDSFYEKLDQLMSTAPKVSILFADMSYFAQILPILEKDYIHRINEVFEHAYKEHKNDPSFMNKYRFLKTFMESNIFVPVQLKSISRIAIISKN